MRTSISGRTHRTRGRLPVLQSMLSAALALPFVAAAQMTMPMAPQQPAPASNRESTPATPSTSVKAQPKPTAKTTPAKARAASGQAPAPPMDHSKMDGMDHSKMEGMDHSQMEGTDHSKMDGMDHSRMDGMDDSQMDAMDHSQMEGMDHSKMDGMDHSKMDGMDHSTMEGMDHSEMDGMSGMDMGGMTMQGGDAPPDARDPDYSDGVSSSHMAGMGMHGESRLGSVIIDQLEAFDGHGDGDGARGQSLDAQAWYGSDLDKVWFKADGERSDGRLEDLRTELLWNRAIATYWGVQAGVRHDFGEGPGRTWAAVGVQGLAPYWFDVEATAYIGQSGRTAVRVEAEYELLLTQRLILQPDVEANLYGKDDRARGIGAGLSDINVGLRLRYEFTRKFAPYIGISYTRTFGNTADIAREELGQVDDTQLVAGVRLWF